MKTKNKTHNIINRRKTKFKKKKKKRKAKVLLIISNINEVDFLEADGDLIRYERIHKN